MTKKMLIFLCILGLLMISTGAVLYFIPPHAQSSSSVNPFQDYSDNSTYPVLVVRAWNDASYSFGSRTWMFLYEPSFDSPSEGSNLSFPFPYFSYNPGVDKILGGKPILMDVCQISGQAQLEGGFMNATTGTSYNWDGVMEITVAVANPSVVFLVFKPLS